MKPHRVACEFQRVAHLLTDQDLAEVVGVIGLVLRHRGELLGVDLARIALAIYSRVEDDAGDVRPSR